MFSAFVTVWCIVYLLIDCICLCVDILPVSSELPIGGDQEEPVYEEDTQFVEEGKWFSPSPCLNNVYFTCCYGLN
jgi:hypothetical protein